MSTHEFVYQTFLIYLLIKSLVFFPLVWIACVYWWSERKQNAPVSEHSKADQEQLAPGLTAIAPLLQ
jgi:hypothetical protein